MWLAYGMPAMNDHSSKIATVQTKRLPSRDLNWPGAGLLGTAGIVCFHLAYLVPGCAFLVSIYLLALCALTGLPTLRRATYAGLAMGLGIAMPQLAFFARIFGAGAVLLWLIFGAWIALFVALGWCCRRRWPAWVGLACLPILWTGCEYFRSELYYLRFAWLTPGFAYAGVPGSDVIHLLGSYGVGFVLAAGAAVVLGARSWYRLAALACLLAIAALPQTMQWHQVPPASTNVYVSGVQMEFPSADEVIAQLDTLRKDHPKTQVFVLSEYTFDHEVPAAVRDWCTNNRTYLVVGAIDQQPEGDYDTAFVIGPAGTTVFSQAKTVPIQFMKDGLPARQQRVWWSPWGAIGICICYDLSYSRVTDELVRQGARALIVPTMDVQDWGAAEHRLHGHVAPVRAAEYGVPIFRVASSGISQLVDTDGRVLATAPCPGVNAQIAGTLELGRAGQLPMDRWLSPACVGACGALILWLIAGRWLAANLDKI
jgi:apolipoprotein N-acyltransferase